MWLVFLREAGKTNHYWDWTCTAPSKESYVIDRRGYDYCDWVCTAVKTSYGFVIDRRGYAITQEKPECNTTETSINSRLNKFLDLVTLNNYFFPYGLMEPKPIVELHTI